MTKTLADTRAEAMDRMELNLTAIDTSWCWTSVAISLKRIADNTLTLRDQFAMAAIQQLLKEGFSGHLAAEMAYNTADEMIIAREERT